MARFCRYDLRTTDAPAARAFYAKVLGHDRAPVWPLHEQALARGAKPHWLGRLGFADVEGTAAALVERGATRFGPTAPTADGGTAVFLRDPGGAVVAVGTPPPADAPNDVRVAWHVLHASDAPRATAAYVELCGWALADRVDLGDHGTFQPFAWESGGASAGAIGEIAERPGVHPHWLYFFEVDALEPAIAATRALGGVVVVPLVVLPTGARACVCDDPQGAAFAIAERRAG